VTKVLLIAGAADVVTARVEILAALVGGKDSEVLQLERCGPSVELGIGQVVDGRLSIANGRNFRQQIDPRRQEG
jgi:hypothetical protein